MSSNEILFVRNCEGGVDHDIWNDDALIALYDKALKVAKKEVAQRIAMETNTPTSKTDVSHENDPKPVRPIKKNNIKETGVSSTWKEGEKCRAVYSEDGLQYEASIKEILNDKMCIVTYIGYGNDEKQQLSALLPSKGKHERNKQILNAQYTECKENSESDHTMNEERSSYKGSKNKKKKSFKPSVKNFDAGCSFTNDYSFPLPHGTNCAPPLPPPMSFLSQENGSLSEDKTLYQMLVSWYMSGYYTGLFQGQKMGKQSRNKN